MPARPKAELPPSSWKKNPGYVIRLEPVPARVRVELGGEIIADSNNARVMYELGHAPVYYLPREDVRMDLLEPTDCHSHCPYKGDASYFSVTMGKATAENAVWSYEDPYDEMAVLKDWLGFYWDRFDAWYEDDRRVESPRETDARINERNNFAAVYPDLAADWHPEKNPGINPYEFPPDSDAVVWWKNVNNDEWEESIHSRVSRTRSD